MEEKGEETPQNPYQTNFNTAPCTPSTLSSEPPTASTDVTVFTSSPTALGKATESHFTPSTLLSDLPIASADASTIPNLSPEIAADLGQTDQSLIADPVEIRNSPSAIAISSPNTAAERHINPNPLRGIAHRKEARYPMSGSYLSPLGGGALSPTKRPIFSPNTNRKDRWPTPSIDTTRPERKARMSMEGWPTSPRRMQLGSPRFKSLTDLEEAPEAPEQPDGATVVSTANTLGDDNVPSSARTLEPMNDADEPDRDDGQNEQPKDPDKGPMSSSEEHTKDIPSASSFAPPTGGKGQLARPRLKMTGNARKWFSPIKEDSSGSESAPGKMGMISEEEEQEEDTEGTEDNLELDVSTLRVKNLAEKRQSVPLLGEISEEAEESGDASETTSEPSSERQCNLLKNGSSRKPRTFGDIFLVREKPGEVSKSDHPRKPRGASLTRFLPSIQSRRTSTNLLSLRGAASRKEMLAISETEDEDDEFDQFGGPQRSDSSSIPVTPSTPVPLASEQFVPSAELETQTSRSSWRWPKRPFSPARDKFKEENLVRPEDNPAHHIGKVGNIWAKKTLGQLRQFHMRKSPSILGRGRGFSLKSSSKDTLPLQPPVRDLIPDSTTSVTVPEQPLETINEEEEDEDIGVWSSEEVDLTDSTDDKKPPPFIANVIPSPTQIVETIEEPVGMKVSPERLTVVGIPAVHQDTTQPSPNPAVRIPANSSLAKSNAKPLDETTFTISNVTDDPLRFEILWPAFRFDVSPAYGIVKPRSVTVVKISVMMKHLAAGSRRGESGDSRRLVNMLKGTEKEGERPLMGMTRILVFCENGERKEVLVEIVAIKKSQGDSKPVKTKGFRRTMDDLLKAARVRAKKNGTTNGKSRTSSTIKGKGTGASPSGSASRLSVRRTNSSGTSASRSSSPESRHPTVRNRTVGSSSARSRPTTPDANRQAGDRKSSISPNPVSRSRGSDETRQTRQPPKRKNLICIGVMGSVTCPDTTVRETTHSSFRIHNPTQKHVTWHLTTATNPFLRRAESSTSAQKITNEVFLIMKTSGFLRPGQSERIDYSFRPLSVGTYVQNFMLEDTLNSEEAGGLGGVPVRIQGDGKENVSLTAKEERRGGRPADFVVPEKEVRIAPTRVGKRRSVGFKITNPSNHLIRIRCKCEMVSRSGVSNVLSIPLSSVQIKPRAYVTLPVRFLPKEVGKVQGIVRLQAVGRSEVKVDIIAEGILDATVEASTQAQ